jgi:hypothetical protein
MSFQNDLCALRGEMVNMSPYVVQPRPGRNPDPTLDGQVEFDRQLFCGLAFLSMTTEPA